MATIYVDPLNGTDNADAGRGETDGTSAYASISYALANYGSFSSTEQNVIYLADTAADILSASLDTDTSVASVESPLLIEGYHYDGANGGTAGALTVTLPWGRVIPGGHIDGNDAVTHIFDASTTYTHLRNLHLFSTTSYIINTLTGSSATNCQFSDAGSTIYDNLLNACTCVNCFFEGAATSGQVARIPLDIIACEAKGGDEAIVFNNASGRAMFNLIYDFDEVGIECLSDNITVINNTFDGAGGAADVMGIANFVDSAAYEGTVIADNVFANFDGASAKAIYLPAGAPAAMIDRNAFWNNTVDDDTPTTATNSITESSDPFTNRVGGDYSLAAGASSRDAARFLGSLDGSNFFHVGAWQEVNGAGGGTPGMTAHFSIT